MRHQFITIIALLFYISNISAYPSIGRVNLIRRSLNIAIREDKLLYNSYSLINRDGINKALIPLRELLARSKPSAKDQQAHYKKGTTHVSTAEKHFEMQAEHENHGEQRAALAHWQAGVAHNQAAAAYDKAYSAGDAKTQANAANRADAAARTARKKTEEANNETNKAITAAKKAAERERMKQEEAEKQRIRDAHAHSDQVARQHGWQ